MSSVSIGGIWTMNPRDIWTPVNSFVWDDPFGYLMEINYSDDLVADQVTANLQWQLANPRGDPTDLVWWRVVGGTEVLSPTVDFTWNGVPVTAGGLGYSIKWGK